MFLQSSWPTDPSQPLLWACPGHALNMNADDMSHEGDED